MDKKFELTTITGRGLFRQPEITTREYSFALIVPREKNSLVPRSLLEIPDALLVLADPSQIPAQYQDKGFRPDDTFCFDDRETWEKISCRGTLYILSPVIE